MWRFLMLASVGVPAAGCFGSGSTASSSRHGLREHSSFIPPRIAQDMRDYLGEYGKPRVVAEGRRPTALGSDSARTIYGYLVRGRFVVVGPPSPGKQPTRTTLDEGTVLVDSHGTLRELHLWDRHSPRSAAFEAAFRRLFGTHQLLHLH